MSVTIDDLDNSESAELMWEETQAKRQQEKLSRQEALATKRRLEQRREDDTQPVHVPLRHGETIAMEPLAEGKALELARQTIEAERGNDRAELIVAMDEMRQVCADNAVHGDVFDREFWNGLDRDEMKGFWEAYGLKSRGGDDAGN